MFRERLKGAPRSSFTADSTPDAFSFTDVTNVGLSATITSAPITVSGINVPVAVTASGGTANINGGSFSTSPGNASSGDLVRARHTSSGSASTAVNTAVTIGGVSDTFTSTTSNGSQTVISPADLSFVGNLRVTQQLGPGGTGRLDDVGPAGTFWKNTDGTIDFFMMGQNYEGYATRYPLVQFRYDPATQTPNASMSSAPQMAFVRDWGEFRTGHLISAAGNETNWVNGALFMEAHPTDSNKRLLWWTYGDGYVPNVDYPTLSCSVLNMTTHAITTYGPWRGDVVGRRYLTGQIIKLPSAFVAANCPGYSKAIIGLMGSGLQNSPFGPSLIAIQDFNPETQAAATGTGQAANFSCKYLIHHDYNNRKSRATDFKLCTWNGGNGTTQKYACQYGFSIATPSPYWGGTANGSPSGIEETDSQQAVAWVDLGTKRGALFFCKMNGRPPGGSIDPHMGYAKSLHVSDNEFGSVETSTSGTYHDKACCHNYYDPEWGSTGPFSTSRRPKVIIYDSNQFANSTGVGGATNPWAFTPTTDAFDLYDVHSGVPTHLATSASDYTSIFGFGGSTWIDTSTARLYVVGAYDFVTDGSGSRLPHIMVFQIAT